MILSTFSKYRPAATSGSLLQCLIEVLWMENSLQLNSIAFFFGIPRALSVELNLGGLISIGKLRSSCPGRRMIDLHGGSLKHSMSTLKLNKMRRLYMYKYQGQKI